MEEILWRALEAKVGIAIRTNDVALLKQKLYGARAKARSQGNLAFDNLCLITPVTDRDTTLWVVKETKPEVVV